ncbi:porin, partial [bacterium]|nr:porin [bacterium]
EDGAEFRAARLFVSGRLYKHVVFKAEYDFAGGDADFKDVYIGLDDIPFLGEIKVGHFKEPFGLEELTSSRFVTFMERASISEFVPGRNTGVAFQNAVLDKRATYAFGVFREADDFGTSEMPTSWNLTGRVTAAPYRSGSNVIHLGVAYSHKFVRSNGADIRLRQRPESHLARRFVDTGTFEAENIDLLGAEAAVVFGPFSAQGEFLQAWINTGGGLQNIDGFRGGYALVSYFITGESRAYKDKSGAFDRVKPKKNFYATDSEEIGCGAWELAGRFSHLRLNDRDAPILGGEMNDFTVGVNWYLNPNVRVMANWINSYVAGAGTSQVYQMRFQVDF